MRKIGPALVLLASLVATLPASATPRTETKEYVAANGIYYACIADNYIGGACFSLDGSETTVEITVVDVTGLVAPAHWGFQRGLATALGDGPFCSTSGPIAVPDGADTLLVWVGGLGDFPEGFCGGAAVTGTITASFS